MLSIRTDDDWTAADFTIDEGGPAQVFTPAAAENSAKDALDALATWYAANFGGTMTWAWVEDATTGGASVTMTFSSAVTIASNAAAQALSGLPASSGSSTAHTSVWTGTIDPPTTLDLVRWVRHHQGEGHASGAGTLRSGIPGSSPRAPLVRTFGTTLHIARLASEMAGAARPRQGWIYQEHETTWRLCSLGDVTHRPAGPLHHEIELAVLG